MESINVQIYQVVAKGGSGRLVNWEFSGCQLENLAHEGIFCEQGI
jgi:hypothetical protein